MRRLVGIAAVTAGVVTVTAIVAIVAIRLAPQGRVAGEARSEPEEPAADAPAPPRVARPATAPAAAPADHPPPVEHAPAGPAARLPGAPPPIEIRERTGIQLFPPPGTNPIKRGIIVPGDFELPPGYVRHYQTTDDGTQLPPILMFHPDYQPVDARGQPVALPPDRVVPPEMAPPGLPVRMLELPAKPGAPDRTP